MPKRKSEMHSVWVAILLTYAAPANAVDWPGPWSSYGMAIAGKNIWSTEAECRNDAVQWIGRVHGVGMLAPIRFQCVAFPASLPKGAPR
jgi:hypothetical protein